MEKNGKKWKNNPPTVAVMHVNFNSYLAQMRVELDRSRVSIERVPVLVKLIVQHPKRTPHIGVLWITIAGEKAFHKNKQQQIK